MCTGIPGKTVYAFALHRAPSPPASPSSSSSGTFLYGFILFVVFFFCCFASCSPLPLFSFLCYPCLLCACVHTMLLGVYMSWHCIYLYVRIYMNHYAVWCRIQIHWYTTCTYTWYTIGCSICLLHERHRSFP